MKQPLWRRLGVDAWLEVIIVTAVLVLVVIITTQGRSRPAIYLPADRWECTDWEDDGCAEYRREHGHPMPGSAKR